ncbi:MAG: hypothetical protein AAF826_07320 [Pseudomonadota bacterium]
MLALVVLLTEPWDELFPTSNTASDSIERTDAVAEATRAGDSRFATAILSPEGEDTPPIWMMSIKAQIIAVGGTKVVHDIEDLLSDGTYNARVPYEIAPNIIADRQLPIVRNYTNLMVIATDEASFRRKGRAQGLNRAEMAMLVNLPQANVYMKEMIDDGIPNRGFGCFADVKRSHDDRILAAIIVFLSSPENPVNATCLEDWLLPGQVSAGTADQYIFTDLSGRQHMFEDNSLNVLRSDARSFCRQVLKDNSIECARDVVDVVRSGGKDAEDR